VNTGADPGVHFVDADLLIAEKPGGLLSVPGRLPANKDCVLSRLHQGYTGLTAVHRLDLETSGLMVLARNPTAHRALSRQFELRQVAKTYEAVVWGVMVEADGLVEVPLAADWPRRPRQKACMLSGKPALTRYTVIARSMADTRLRLHPVTGRSHQLRVHLQHLGHPILGCPLYAHDEAYAAATRLLLHASQLGLRHPSSGLWMTWTSPPPF